MIEYVEIQNPKELARLNRALSEKLKDKTVKTARRTIGYPRGNFSANVRFLSGGKSDSFWWRGSISKDKTKAHNLFGHGTPGSIASLNIDVQFNIPIEQFSRSFGGAFLRHVSTGTIFLAHRGIVTLGHGRVQKRHVFEEITATICEASAGELTSEFLLITELDSPTLVSDVKSFSAELRRTVKAIKASQPTDTGSRRSHIVASEASMAPPGELGEYFDEFSGQLARKARKKTIADCHHGTVVRALRDALINTCQVFKTREIDLIAPTPGGKVLLLEVKTSTDTQSIYTAIGQLSVHAHRIVQYFDQKPLDKWVVLPAQPIDRLSHSLRELGIKILIFDRSRQGRITISGIDQLE